MDDIKLSPCQALVREEFSTFLMGKERFFILTGAPGRGKSFITKLLVDDVRSLLGDIPIHTTATTNKAAKVVADFVKQDAATIHSLLGLRVRNNTRTGRTDLIRSPDSKIIHNAFILIDEISMLDEQLLIKLDESTVNCRFLLVGDKDQLASISHSKPPVFNKGYTQFELKTPMRQERGNKIIALAEQFKETIRTGVFKPIVADGTDVISIDGEEFKELVDTKFAEDTPVDTLKIICWKNDSVRAYNDYIRGRHFDEKHFVIGETVVTNQPIMTQSQIVYSTDEFAVIVDVTAGTEYGVDGYWYRLNRGAQVFQAHDQNDVKRRLTQLANSAKEGGGWASYFHAKEFFGDLRAVHSCTTYKSQGSSYDMVFIDLGDIGECRQWEQVARQLYVAITRARFKVYLYGELPHKYNDFTHATKSG